MDTPKVTTRPIIGVNTLCIVPGRNRGVQTYLDELLSEITSDDSFEWVVFVSHCNRQHYQKRLSEKTIRFVECELSGRNRFFRVIYEQLVLQRKACAEGCDLLFFPGYLGPVKKLIPTVLTIHDMQFRDIPKGLSRFFRILYETVVPRAVREADMILTVSEFSKTRIIAHFPGIRDKVVVTHLAADGADDAEPHALSGLSEREASMLEDLFSDERKYLLSVSSPNPHKNIERLVDAFETINTDQRYRLVLVGVERDDHAHGVVSTGYLSDEARDIIYSRASGYVFASLYEGFGLPLLEAMAAGLPVAAATSGSLPEIGGDACIYFAPENGPEIAEAMTQLLNDEPLRQQLIAKGKERLLTFSWAKTAEITAAVFHDVAAKNRGGRESAG